MASCASDLSAAFVIVGGGIAGVTCAETLGSESPQEKVILITASSLVKTVINFQQISRTLETFDVEERPSSMVESCFPNVHVLQTMVVSLDTQAKVLSTCDGKSVKYNKLCICTGGKPKLIAGSNPLVMGIRDTESVKDFQKKLLAARRLVIVGNGGIATELVYEVEGCEVIWAIKDESISSTFVDKGAAQFFLPNLTDGKTEVNAPTKRLKYTHEEGGDDCRTGGDVMGSALGPDWASSHPMKGAADSKAEKAVHVEYAVEVTRVMDPLVMRQSGLQTVTPPSFMEAQHDWPVFVELDNGTVYGCDLVVSATGVIPFTDPFLPGNSFEVAEDLGLKVNTNLETSVPDVYAAGDVCTASWQLADLWIQMRLWTQARQMGCYAAKSMLAAHRAENISLDVCFELFAHVTKFFGYKVVLIGRFNAQGLGNDYELLLRVTPGEEYVKVVLHQGKLVGAILIGETDLEETFENLALNGTDLTAFKDHLLEPNIDIQDYFD